MKSKTNGELLKTSLDAITEYVRRGNKQLERTRQAIEFEYEAYLGLKSLATAIAMLDPDRPEEE